jgi:glycosyltransferase involved in cell wall biosynthesis
VTAVHQFVPTLEPGAVGNHTLEVQRTLQDAGIRSEVFTEFLDPSMEGRARLYGSYGVDVVAAPDDLLMYQFAIGSVVASYLRTRPERKALYHHNLTPPEMLAGWEPEQLPGLRWGRRQLLELAADVDFALAVSTYNRDDLRDSGYHEIDVVPILLDLDRFDREVDESTRRRLERDRATGGRDLLFVGRVVPNKCQHNLIKAFVAYRRGYDPRARLRIVGEPASPRYVAALQQFAHDAGVGEAVDFAGAVSAGALSAYYRSADVFVSASEHEGFCVPLLEAMHHRIPIVAVAAAAVPETVRDAGVLLVSRSPAEFAAAIHAVVVNTAFREHLTRAGAARLADFGLPRTRRRLLDVLAARGVGTSG